MSEAKLNPFTKLLFLSADEEGRYSWTDRDPLTVGDIKAAEINLEDELFSCFGEGSVHNPIIISIKGVMIKRSEPFDVGAPGRIWNGENIHIEDVTGSLIEVLSVKNEIDGFPFNAVVLHPETKEIIETRVYSSNGKCSDGNAKHDLVVVRNTARQNAIQMKQMKAEVKEEPAAAVSNKPFDYEKTPESESRGFEIEPEFVNNKPFEYEKNPESESRSFEIEPGFVPDEFDPSSYL